MAAKPKNAKSVRLRPQNPFDLIRLLARSQSDPRKAVAELVQNSLDAGATRVEITWFQERGVRAIAIWDDGAGVFPELEREDALRRIAQTVGHSHKRDLTPAQRREEMILGKYGIGLIGFWSVGRILEMRSRVHGGRATILRLTEDQEHGEVIACRSRRLDEAETFTEIVIREVHDAAVNKVRPARLQAYLAQELRGQLLDRGAVVMIHDRVTRGRGRKLYRVEPRPYLGMPIEDLRTLEVPGYEDARVELYRLPAEEERRGVVALSCGGTVVLDDIATIDGGDALRAPWSSGRFEGVIDFPELHVAPANRRGFAHDEPVAAFLESLRGLEVELEARSNADSQRRDEIQKEHLARDIRKAFASVARALPDYDFFDIRPERRARANGLEEREPGVDGAAIASDGDDPDGLSLGTQPPSPVSDEALAWPRRGAHTEGDTEGDAAGDAARDDRDDREPQSDSPGADRSQGAAGGAAADAAHPGHDSSAPPTEAFLFPAGPLDQLDLSPRRLRVQAGSSRGLVVRTLDADGRVCRGHVDLHWSLSGAGEIEVDGVDNTVARYTAPADVEGEDATATIHVQATQGAIERFASCEVRIPVPDVSARVQGIPDPRAVSDPSGNWRSRVVDGRWEFNDAHRDFLVVADVEARRLRYLIHLFAKEIVLRNFGRPGDAENLERMVEVLTRLDAAPRR